MLTNEDVVKVYATILSSPGMNDTVKIDLRVTRKNVLLLNRVIERGITNKGEETTARLLDTASGETLHDLLLLAEDCLKKAGLTNLSEKLKLLDSS